MISRCSALHTAAKLRTAAKRCCIGRWGGTPYGALSGGLKIGNVASVEKRFAYNGLGCAPRRRLGSQAASKIKSARADENRLGFALGPAGVSEDLLQPRLLGRSQSWDWLQYAPPPARSSNDKQRNSGEQKPGRQTPKNCRTP